MKARILTILLLVALVVAVALLPAQAETQDPATTGMNAPLDFATSTTQVCPKCGTEETWQPLTEIAANTTLAAGHYYVPDGGLTNSAQYNVNSKAVRCIHLNGQTLSSSARVFNLSYNATLNVFGSGAVKSTAKGMGGALYYLGSCTVNLYGGNHNVNATESYPIRSTESEYAKLNIYDGTAVSSGKWRTVYMTTGTVTMNGGTITGGNVSTKNGGSVLISGGTFDMKGGSITGGKATNGGNVSITKGTFTMSGSSSISSGTATGNGGNVYVSGGTFKMTGGSITGGSAVNGGSVTATGTSAVLNISGGSISGGTSSSHGGTLLVDSGATMNMSGGTVNGGTAGGQGGTMRVYNSTVNLSGDAKVYAGSTTSTDMLTKGIWLIDSKLNMSGNATVYGNRTTVHGNAVYATQDAVGSTVTLSGGATIKNQTGISEKNLFLNYNATYPNKLQITQDWVGEAYWYALKDADNSYAPGSTIATTQAQVGTVTDGVFTAGGTFQGSLYYGVYTAGSMEAAEGVVVLPADSRPNPANTGKNAPIDFATSTTQVCPVCGGTAKTWQPLPQISTNTVLAAGHYYVPEGGVSNTAQYTFDSNGVRCIHLNGNTIASTTRLFNITNNAMINIFGSGQVNCNTGKELSDGAIAYLSTARLRFYGGTYSVSKGTPIWLSGSNSNFILYDGATITGGTVGNVRVANGTFTMEGGTISGGSDANGGNIRVTGGTFNMKGGTITGGTATTGGGNVYVSGGTFKMTGGKLNAGTAVNGGNLYVAGGIVTLIDDGNATTKVPQILGGSATDGGNIYAAATLTVSGGTVASGIASGNGGNIYATGELSLTNCTVSDGQATAGEGGNIAIAGTNDNRLTCNFGEGAEITGGKAKNGGSLVLSYTTLNYTAASLSGGYASANGGNIHLSTRGILKMTGGLIDGGTSKSSGGNIYMSTTTSNCTITGGTVSGGVANSTATYTGGGNIYVHNGNCYIYGGTISGGQALNGGNINSRAGRFSASNKLVVDGNGDPSTPKPVITNGQSQNTGGNIYINGYHYDFQVSYFELGDCEITNGDSTKYNYGDDISIQHSGIIKVRKSFAGEADIYIAACCLPVEAVGGRVDPECGSAEGSFPGKLRLDQKATKPLLVGKDGDTGLYVSESALVHKDGTYTFFVDNASMMAAYDDTVAYVRACPGDLPLDGGEYVVDLLGNTVNFTGNGTVTCFDSKNDDYEVNGTATFDVGVTLANPAFTTYNDKSYATLNDNGTYSFHRFDVKLTGVSLRPSAGGIYYTAQWSCDDILKEHIDNFGVAVSIMDEPGTDFTTDGHSRYTKFAKTAFENGVKKTGVLVTGILKDTNQDRIGKNAEYAQKQIHATAYMSLDGDVQISASKSFSMKDVLDVLNDRRETFAESAINTMQGFMTKWASKGLSGTPWSEYTFNVSQDVYHLESLYANRVAYHGEFHDHANTGGTSDGKVTLTRIKEVMAVRGMDFTTILDHSQILHMEMEEWDDTMFIGGSETNTILDGAKADTGNDMHINMIFSNPEDFVKLMEKQTRLKWAQDAETGEWHYEATRYTTAQLKQLIQDIKDSGGMYVFPHPKDGTRFIHDDPLDYWFADEVGLEVLTVKTNDDRTRNAYKLWTDLLKAGKRIWATAGSDSHSLPNTNALTTIYSDRKHADAYLGYAKVGDTTCGPVGVRMCVGDTLMGGQTSFDGKRLVFCIDDVHESVDLTKQYTIKLIEGRDGEENVVASWDQLDTSKPLYYYMDADNAASYYRVEIYDVAIDSILALGNPIWNTQEG